MRTERSRQRNKKKMRRRQRRRRVDKINKMENVQCIHVISNCFLFIIYGTIPRHHQHITESFVSSCFFHPFSCGRKIEKNLGTKLWRTEQREFVWPSSHLSENGKWYFYNSDRASAIMLMRFLSIVFIFNSMTTCRRMQTPQSCACLSVCVWVLCCFIPFWSYLRLSWLA